jgi:PHD/YefM family antitoxin component YafN of YafNO toxin-antitoxin module
MVQYTEKELKSATYVARNFGNLLENLKSGKIEKIAVLRNNKLDAVIIHVDEYNRLKEREDLQEHTEIYNIVKNRMNDSKEKRIPWDEALAILGIDKDEL